MTALSDQIIRQLLLSGRQSANAVGEALDWSTPVIERQLERMAQNGTVLASIVDPEGPTVYALTAEMREFCRSHCNDRQQVELIR